MTFLTKIGVMQGRLSDNNMKSLSVYPKYPVKEFDTAAELKLNHIEFITKESSSFQHNNFIWNDKKINALNKLYKSKGLKNISFIDNRSIKKNFNTLINYYKKLIVQLSKAKFKIFIIPLFKKSELKNKNLINFSKSLDIISNYCEKRKITFLIESNIDFKSFIKLKKIMKSKIGITYDTGNKFLNNDKEYLKDIILFKDNIKHVHLKDRDSNGKNVIFGKGNVNFVKIFKNLKLINYKGNFTIESTRQKNAKSTLIKNFMHIKSCLKN